MQPSLFQKYRAKVKLTLNLPQPRLKSKSSVQVPYKQPSMRSEESRQSVQSQDALKTPFDTKYSVEQALGQGAHGFVKACTLKQKNQKYAVKIMKLDQEISFMYRKNFLTMKCLNHPNILKYRALYLDKSKQTSFLVMQYLPYPTLRSLKIQSQQELKFIATQILNALVYMHKKNICHRDLKTQNILYSREEKKLKIIDFGICKKMTIRQQKSQMVTSTGTLAYKAPQMFEGGGYDQKIDLWALGVILYELVTGKNPFFSQFMTDTIRNIQNLQVYFCDDHWDKYDKLLKDLIAHLLKKNRSQRFNANEALNHLYFKRQVTQIINSSHHHRRQKPADLVVQKQFMTLMIPKNVGQKKKITSQPQIYIGSTNSLGFNFVDSQEQQGIF